MPNTYVMTKAAAEQLIKHEAKGLPVTIFRPAIGTYGGKQLQGKNANYYYCCCC